MAKTNIAIGGNEILELIYNLINKSDFAFKYNSYGFFNSYQKINTGLFRIKNTDSNYLGQSFQSFDGGKYKINNLFRPSTVAVSLSNPVTEPSVIDTSRFTIGGSVSTTGSVNVTDEYITNPSVKQKMPISAYYGALKFNFDNQYGQLDGIKQVQMRGCVEYLDPTKPDAFKYSSSAIFSGDIFITRYTEKVIMPIFAQYLLGQPDEFTYDYSQHVNIPYPRFWLNSQKFDMSTLAEEIASLGFASSGELDNVFPNDLFYLDRGSNSCASGLNAIFGGSGDPNPKFAMRYAYMYTHVNGILDFFVESEVNLANRDWEDRTEARIYDVYGYNDIDELFHAQIEKKDNFYKYDESLSPSKFVTQLGSFGEIQPRYYNPYTAETCYVSYPKRLIYSLQAQKESKKDFWRVFLPFNYQDFKNKVSVIKPINKNGAIIFFPFLSPQMFQGVDILKTSLDTKLTIGDGGLFSQPFQNIVNADLSNEYGSCESLRSVMNTPVGLFFISQAQGKIFHFTGQTLDPISNAGMKWWFNKYLPSQLVKQYPQLEASPLSDNPVVGVGCQTIYDPNDDIVYFMKKDYRVKSTYIANITYTENKGFALLGNPITLGDPIYFDDCSWTVSYDPKAKAWISFHDWHPEFALPSINHFFTTKTMTTTIPQCPPGYTYNAANGLCEQSINISERAIVTVDQVNSVVSGGFPNPYTCNCPSGYTKVFYNPTTNVYTSPTGICNNIKPPVCRKVTCACPISPVGTTTTTTGNCDDVYLVGNPTYVNPNPKICNYFKYESTPANFKVGSFWRHNARCDSFANFYGTDYPWEVELVSNTGQMVNTVRSMEYQLETYVYKGDMGFACNDDRWEDLNFNFDQSIIYNNEQVSGLLQLTPTPYNNPVLELSYPIINTNSINILCSKVEQKYRFNQFYDITKDRGEFTNAEQPIWDTQPNGYIKVLNTINLNYNKAPLQHKKFRHYYTNVILRRVKSENRKMLLRLNNTKLLLSMR
jgi:hypothetical protein